MCLTLDGNHNNHGQIMWNLDQDPDSEMEGMELENDSATQNGIKSVSGFI